MTPSLGALPAALHAIEVQPMPPSAAVSLHPESALHEACNALENHLRTDIPLARAMDLRVSFYDGVSLGLSAPLAPNINDKGCAFGGSMASVLTLSCWGLIKLAADLRGVTCDIYVQDSSIRYLAPVWDDFVAVSELDANDDFDTFFTTLASRDKARLSVHAQIRGADGRAAATLSARFVALASKGAARVTDAAQSALAS